MTTESVTVTSLVTEELLKEALTAKEVLTPLKAAVKKLLSEQIDEAVETALSSLTGGTVKEIDTGENAAAESQDAADGTAEDAGVQSESEEVAEAQAAGDAAAETDATAQVTEVKTAAAATQSGVHQQA